MAGLDVGDGPEVVVLGIVGDLSAVTVREYGIEDESGGVDAGRLGVAEHLFMIIADIRR